MLLLHKGTTWENHHLITNVSSMQSNIWISQSHFGNNCCGYIKSLPTELLVHKKHRESTSGQELWELLHSECNHSASLLVEKNYNSYMCSKMTILQFNSLESDFKTLDKAAVIYVEGVQKLKERRDNFPYLKLADTNKLLHQPD